MNQNPNKLSQFWHELKRRRVIKVIAMYAGAAYVLIELANNVVAPLNLPEWTPTLVILLLVVGFPITVILSWIFDVTPEGIRKTESPEDITDRKAVTGSEPGPEPGSEPGSEPQPARTGKLFSVSNFIIALLFVAVCILLYPKIFKHDKLKELRDEEGIISLAVLPFDNLTGDSSLYYWQNGISEYLINKLGGSQELAVSSSQVVSDVLAGTRQVNAASLSPDIARRTAIKIDASTYITGNFIGKENDASIMLSLVNTESGEMIWTTSVDGDLEGDYRAVLGHLADTVRNYMEIRALEEQAGTELTNAYPNSAESYRHYIDGLNAIMDSDYEKAVESLEKAYEIDSTFTFAAFYLAFAHNFGRLSDDETLRWTRRAHELKDNLPSVYRPWIEMWYSGCFTKDINDIRRYNDMMFEAALHSRLLLLDLAVTYTDFVDDYSKAIQAYQKIEDLNEQWEDDWRYDRYYESYAWTLLMNDRPDDAERIIEKGLQVNPDNGWLNLARGAVHVMRGDSIAAKRSEQEIREIVRNYSLGISQEEYYVGQMYALAKDSLTAAGYFRRAWELDPERIVSLSLLIDCQLDCNINLEECLELAEYRLEKQPDSWGARTYVGNCLYKLGRYEEALTYLREADEMLPGYHKEIRKSLNRVEQALALQTQQ